MIFLSPNTQQKPLVHSLLRKWKSLVMSSYVPTIQNQLILSPMLSISNSNVMKNLSSHQGYALCLNPSRFQSPPADFPKNLYCQMTPLISVSLYLLSLSLMPINISRPSSSLNSLHFTKQVISSSYQILLAFDVRLKKQTNKKQVYLAISLSSKLHHFYSSDIRFLSS